MPLNTACPAAGILPGPYPSPIPTAWARFITRSTAPTRACPTPCKWYSAPEHRVEAKGITLSGTTATVRLPDHGLVNGQTVAISGASQGQYNTTSAVIFNVTQDTFDYTVTGSPTSPATGTIYVTPYGITRNGTTATVTLPGHGFANGNLVLITGATPDKLQRHLHHF